MENALLPINKDEVIALIQNRGVTYEDVEKYGVGEYIDHIGNQHNYDFQWNNEYLQKQNIYKLWDFYQILKTR